MLGFGLQVLYQPPELWQMDKEVQPTTMVYFQPGEHKDVPIQPELTIGRKYYSDQLPRLRHDPVAFGEQLAHDAIASARTNDIQYWVGPTEPPVASPEQVDRLIACEKARAEILNAWGLKAVVFYLSVGWPLENVADRTLYTGQFDAFLRQLPTQNLVALNEYFYPTGPLHKDSYSPNHPSRIWRFKHWPGIDRHKIFITESGMDIGGNHLTDGWKQQCPPGMNLEEWFAVYMSWMEDYLSLISQDDRVIGATWFCGGPGYSWGGYDVLPYWRKARPLFEGPVPEIPPVVVPPSEDTIRVLVEWPDGHEEVVRMPIETYVEGVLPAELSAQQLRFPDSPECLDVASKNPTCPYTVQTTHMEALRALAVLIRSVALARIDNPRNIRYDIINSDQVYRPWMGHERTASGNIVYARAIQAVADTKGYYLTRDGEHFYASYVNGCGREICCWCKGEGGYRHIEWTGRACQFGLQFMARTLGMSWQDMSLCYYEDDVILIGGLVPPQEPVPPIIEPPEESGMFNYKDWVSEFIANPGINDAQDKGVVVQRAAGAEAKCIGVHCLTNSENTFDHHILLAVVDKDGGRVDNARVDWEWADMHPNEAKPNPVLLDKPEGEPPGNLPIMASMKIIVSVGGNILSDIVSGLSTEHTGIDGEVNRWGHFSYFVAWQIGGEPVPVVPPVVIPPIKPPVEPPSNLEEVIAAARGVRDDIDEVIAMLVRM